jgi:hypothetical protein
VWEVRVVVGFDPGRARSIQRSFTAHGDAVLAARARRELVAGYGSTRSDVRHMASAVTVGELLYGYLSSAQLWKPGTATPPPPCGTTRMPHRSMTLTSPTSSTASSTALTQGAAPESRPTSRTWVTAGLEAGSLDKIVTIVV